MPGRRDPIAKRASEDRDLYEVSEWEPRTWLDRLSGWLYGAIVRGLQGLIVLAAIAILVVQFVLGGLGAVVNPLIGTFTFLSIVPAFLLALYIWYSDVTTAEPLELLVGTFALGLLFAGFAAIGNSVASAGFSELGLLDGPIGFVGYGVFFFVVVGPVEESVKLLAVRLFAFRKSQFDAVLDGAVYGAVAGLGFATIENAIYITRQTGMAGEPIDLVAQGGSIAAIRAFAGPGHVIYSAIAGYYLGLAKFNRDHAGPIVVKGLLLAVVVHATYNTLVGVLPSIVASFLGVSHLLAFVGFVVVYDSLAGLFLYRKLSKYRSAYHDLYGSQRADDPPSELTEFER